MTLASICVEPQHIGCKVKLQGEVAGECVAIIERQIMESTQGQSDVEVDLSGVSMMDFVGLLAMLKVKRRASCMLRFTNHSPAVLRTLEAAGKLQVGQFSGLRAA